MSVAITIEGAGSTAAKLAALAGKLERPTALYKIVEEQAKNQLKLHFRDRDTIPNKLGGRRSHYWQRIAESVSSSQTGEGVVITIGDPTFRQKVFGGTISSSKGPLAIPVNAEAVGIYAKDFTKYKLFVVRNGAGSVAALAARTNPDSKTLEVFYILVPSVTQAPDKDALPDMRLLELGLVERASSYVDRITKNPNANN